MESVINKACEPYKDSFTLYKDNEYRLTIKVTNKNLPIDEIDKVNAEILANIYEQLEEPYEHKKVIWGKQVSGHLIISTYVDGGGTVLNTIRDTQNNIVSLCWIKRQENIHNGII